MLSNFVVLEGKKTELQKALHALERANLTLAFLVRGELPRRLAPLAEAAGARSWAVWA